MAKPKPDIFIGFDGKAFTDRMRAVLEEFDCRVIAEQFFSFFDLEAKNADGPIAESINQCAKGGAAMVKQFRDLFKAINAWLNVSPAQSNCQRQPTQPQPANTTTGYSRPDMTSFVFSVALDPEMAIVFVHWAEITGIDPKTNQETKIWQQTRLRSFFFA